MNNYNMDVVKEFKKLCTPSQFYLILSVLSVVSVFLSTMNLGNLIVSLALATAWAYILNMVCNKVNNTVSWILVLVPIFGVLGLAGSVLLSFL